MYSHQQKILQIKYTLSRKFELTLERLQLLAQDILALS